MENKLNTKLRNCITKLKNKCIKIHNKMQYRELFIEQNFND